MIPKYRLTTGEVVDVRKYVDPSTGKMSFAVDLPPLEPSGPKVRVSESTEQRLLKKLREVWELNYASKLRGRDMRKDARRDLRQLDKRRPGVSYHVLQCFADPELDDSLRRGCAVEWATLGERENCEKYMLPFPVVAEDHRGRRPATASEVAERFLTLAEKAGVLNQKDAERLGRAWYGMQWSHDFRYDDYARMAKEEQGE